MYHKVAHNMHEAHRLTKLADTQQLRRAADIASRGGMGLGLGIAGAGLGGLGGLLAAGGHEVFVNENPLLEKSLLKLKGFSGLGGSASVGLYEPGGVSSGGRYRDFKEVLSPERLTKLRDFAVAGGAGGGAAGVLAGARSGLPAISRQTLAKTLAYGLPLGALGLAAGGAGGHLAGQLLEGQLSLGNIAHAIEDGGVRITADKIKALQHIADAGPNTKILQSLGAGAGLGGGIGLGASLARGNIISRIAGDARNTAKSFRAAPVSSSLASLAVGAPLALAGAGVGGLMGNLSAHGLEAYLHPETFDNIGSKVEAALAKPAVLYKKPMLDYFVPKSYGIGKPVISALTYGGAGAGALAGLAGAARLTRGPVPSAAVAPVAPTAVESAISLLRKAISRARF